MINFTAPLVKLPPGWFLFIHEIYFFRQNTDFFKGMECIIFNFDNFISLDFQSKLNELDGAKTQDHILKDCPLFADHTQ